MHLLPTNLAPIADIAAKDEGKYAMTGVNLRLHGDNTYRAAGTDGKRLIVVSGPCAGDPSAFPAGPIHEAPNSCTESIVPAAEWRKTFKAIDKLVKKSKGDAVPCVAVSIGREVTSFSGATPKQSEFNQHPNVEGRFPPYMDVIPASAKATASIDVDCELLVDLLDAMRAYTDDGHRRVRLELHAKGDQGSIVVRSDREHQSAIGLVVALGVPERKGGTLNSDELAAALDREQKISQSLRNQLGDLREDIDNWRNAVAERDDRIAELASELSAIQKEAEELRNELDRRASAALVCVARPIESVRMLSRRERLGGVA